MFVRRLQTYILDSTHQLVVFSIKSTLKIDIVIDDNIHTLHLMEVFCATDEHWNVDLADAAHLDHLSVQHALHAPLEARPTISGGDVSVPLEAHYDHSGTITHYDINRIQPRKQEAAQQQ